MRNLILETIRDNQNNEVFPGIKMKQFSKRIMKIYQMLTFLDVDASTKVGICGNNSRDWIAVYIATLLKGCTLVVIPPFMTKNETLHYMSTTSVNYLFLDTVHSSMYNLLKDKTLLSLQIVFDMHSLKITMASVCIQNMLIDMNIMLDEQFNINDICLNDDYPNDVETIITPTLGTSFPEQKYVVHSSTNILRFLEDASKRMPFKQFNKIQVSASYSRFHLISVLIPFIKGCIITYNKDDVNYFIESTESFEQMWKYKIQPVSYGKLGSFLLSKDSWYWLYKILVLLKLGKQYGTKHLKGVIVLNSELNEGIMHILRKNLFPLYTTYGSQETPLVAINDFSTMPLRKKNCAGKILDSYDTTIKNKELHLISDTIFNRYYADPNYSEYVVESGWYNTGDIAKIKTQDLLYVYGRNDSYYEKGNVTLDELEKLVEGLPFIQEAMLFIVSNQLYLSVYLDRNFVEAKGWGYIQSKNFIKKFKNTLNAQIKPSIEIEHISVSIEPFKKTFDGTIRKHLYRNVYEIGG